MKIAVIAELHPGQGEQPPGIWARRQAQAAKAVGAEVHVLAPRRPHALSLRALRRRLDLDLIHAHGVVAGDAVRRAKLGMPTIVSVYGRDVFGDSIGGYDGGALGNGARREPRGAARGNGDRAHTISATLGAASITLAGSGGAAELARARGAARTRVVHLGADMPERGEARRHRTPGEREVPTLVTVASLIARKRHADVLRALAVLTPRHPALRYLIVGDGPERPALEGLASRLGVAERVQIVGRLPPQQALARARACTIFAMPSIEEAFGVAYIEAMAAGVPAIGCRGEPGPEEIAAAGDGFVLVPPGDVERLSQRIDELISDPQRLREAGLHARETVAANFTWERCGRQTVAAYQDALR
jgi:glycosyltransferase involved in cell wall biosynthesis